MLRLAGQAANQSRKPPVPRHQSGNYQYNEIRRETAAIGRIGGLACVFAAFEGSVSRLKIAIGLALVAGVAIWAATAFLYPYSRWRWLTGSGRAAIAQGRHSDAEQSFRTALDVARTIRQGELFVATSALDLAEALVRAGRPTPSHLRTRRSGF